MMPTRTRMRKADKKIENLLCDALNKVCDTALTDVVGFKWITHFVDYKDVAGSLAIVCVFETNDELSGALAAHQDDHLRGLIGEKLSAVGISVTDMQRQVSFDTEEACTNEHEGKWKNRFR